MLWKESKILNRKFVNFIVKRYLRIDKKHPFIYISFLLSLLGILTGVATLIIAMGIMNGMDKEFEKKLKVMNYPITIYSNFLKIDNDLVSQLENKFPNMKFSEFIQSSAILQKNSSLNGVLIYGVNFKKEAQINYIFREAIPPQHKIFDIIAGDALRDLFIEDNSAVLIFAKFSPFGIGISPILKKVRVISFFKSGLISYDKSIVYMDINGLKRILHQNHYTGIHVYSKDPFKDIKKIKNFLGKNFIVIGWWQQNGNFFSALKMEKRSLFLVLMLIIIVASLNIISSLLMMVMAKRKEIALMISLGASKKEIKSIFLRLGLIIGILGIILGTIFGFFGIYILKNFDIITLPQDVYGITKLPIDLSFIDFISIISGAFIIVILSSLYPAIKASKTNVLETLRYE